jgi:hypothetical protein
VQGEDPPWTDLPAIEIFRVGVDHIKCLRVTDVLSSLTLEAIEVAQIKGSDEKLVDKVMER